MAQTAKPAKPEEVTALLLAWGGGDQAALDRLVPLVHSELHRIAHRYMGGERDDHTLQTSALVNEAYLRLVKAQGISWQNRAHFFALSAQLMRRILVDHARARQFQKRGGGADRITLEESRIGQSEKGPDLVALDDSLSALAAMDPRKSKVIELRFFGGLSVEETAEVLQVSVETVHRDWRLAKTWLRREMIRQASTPALDSKD